jgi:hypothetical protein
VTDLTANERLEHDIPTLTTRIDIDETWQPAVLGHASVAARQSGPLPLPAPQSVEAPVVIDPLIADESGGGAEDVQASARGRLASPDAADRAALIDALSQAILADLARVIPTLVADALDRTGQKDDDRLESTTRPH